MYYEIIKDDTTKAEDVKRFQEKSLREIQRMEEVIYTLLKLARIDAGTIQMNKQPEDLRALLQDVLERFEVWSINENKKITLVGEQECTIYCDALWISETVGNIVKNALEHMEGGGTITISYGMTPLLTNIIIRDDGSGIHPEDIYHVFKRFYRSKFGQRTQGIGLGLPLAKSIVEAHGGTISVKSTLGEGTEFTINLFNLT